MYIVNIPLCDADPRTMRQDSQTAPPAKMSTRNWRIPIDIRYLMNVSFSPEFVCKTLTITGTTAHVAQNNKASAKVASESRSLPAIKAFREAKIAAKSRRKRGKYAMIVSMIFCILDLPSEG